MAIVEVLQKKFQELAVTIPQILLPKAGIDLQKWAVIACDQFTSDQHYWKNIENFIQASPSTLHLIFPEAYLGEKEQRGRIKKIRQQMEKYLRDRVLVTESPGFIFVDRKTPYTNSRKGLILALDLEEYDYHQGAKTLIRATEGTILDRLPPRIKIRENALLELPHILVLIDDPKRTVIEPLASELTSKHPRLRKLYDFDLMMDSGHLTGYKVEDKTLLTQIRQGLSRLSDPEVYAEKYGIQEPPFLFAVGDGNHSLATAKAVWERIKGQAVEEKDLISHPARYALVEVVNLYDEGLTFEPIHRVLFNVDPDLLLERLEEYYHCEMERMDRSRFSSYLKQEKRSSTEPPIHQIAFVTSTGSGMIKITNPSSPVEAGTLQAFLDQYLSEHKQTKIDYIHGEQVVADLGAKEGNIGFFLPVMDKRDLFKTLILNGALPRKTFSLGEAIEKRFYLECRRICN